MSEGTPTPLNPASILFLIRDFIEGRDFSNITFLPGVDDDDNVDEEENFGECTFVDLSNAKSGFAYVCVEIDNPPPGEEAIRRFKLTLTEAP